MRIRRDKTGSEKHALAMTSMIDIVFLLLVFFVMTFKIAALEGDFHVRMAVGDGPPTTELPLKLRMIADSDGNLLSMRLNDVDLETDFDRLRSKVISLMGQLGPAGDQSGTELVIDTDYALRYSHVISAVTAVTGYKEGSQTVKLIENIRFAKPRRDPVR